MRRTDAGTARMGSPSPRTVYSSHPQRHQSMRGVAGRLSDGHGLFSPGGVMSPFCWDTSAFRFDFDELRARSNLLSLSSDIRDAEEREILQRTEEEELEGTGPSAGPTGNDKEDNEVADDGKRGTEKSQKRKGRIILGNPDVEMKRFKLGVLRNLLANFSLEKTIEKYRKLSSKPFTVRPGDYSFDCAVSAHQLKDKLFRLTGSDRIKINDRHFMQRMQRILEQEDQERVKQADEGRAELEYQRLRKLMQHGVISAKELQDDECLMAVQASAAAAKSRKVAKTQSSRQRTASHSNQCNPGSKPFKCDREDDGLTAEEPRCSTSLPAVRILPAAGSSTGYEHPMIQKMREEKSVKGLYEMAAKLSKMSF